MSSPYQARKAFFKRAANPLKWAKSGIYEAHISKVPDGAYRVFIPTVGSPLNPAPEILADCERVRDRCPSSYTDTDKRFAAWTMAKCEPRYKYQILNSVEAMAELKRACITSRIQPVYFSSLAWSKPEFRFVLLDIVFDIMTTQIKKQEC